MRQVVLRRAAGGVSGDFEASLRAVEGEVGRHAHVPAGDVNDAIGQRDLAGLADAVAILITPDRGLRGLPLLSMRGGRNILPVLVHIPDRGAKLVVSIADALED